MIERHVYLHLHPDQRAGVGEIRAAAREFLPQVPGVVSVRTGAPADSHAAEAWDVVLVVGLESLAAYDLYKDHPLHRRFVDEIVTPRCAVRKAWNFDIEERT